MISWIVASHDDTVLNGNLLATLDHTAYGDELLVLRDAPSITQAYAAGQSAASRPVKVYVHHDVQILDVPRLRSELIEATQGVGMVGVIGSRDAVFPWWSGRLCGSVVDTRPGFGLIDHGPGGECAMLDGLLLATRQHVDWDTDAPGWHGYDMDSCSQMLARGLTNWCLTGAGDYVIHNAAPTKDRTTGFGDAAERWRERWMVARG